LKKQKRPGRQGGKIIRLHEYRSFPGRRRRHRNKKKLGVEEKRVLPDMWESLSKPVGLWGVGGASEKVNQLKRNWCLVTERPSVVVLEVEWGARGKLWEGVRELASRRKKVSGPIEKDPMKSLRARGVLKRVCSPTDQ